MSISIMNKKDKCKELLEKLLTKYPESLEELFNFLIDAEQFYRENREYKTQLLERQEYVVFEELIEINNG
jgi:hypothetical protein